MGKEEEESEIELRVRDFFCICFHSGCPELKGMRRTVLILILHTSVKNNSAVSHTSQLLEKRRVGMTYLIFGII